MPQPVMTIPAGLSGPAGPACPGAPRGDSLIQTPAKDTSGVA